MTAHIAIPYEQIKSFCKRWKVREFSLFGSVLRDDFTPQSDVDVLVTFIDDAEHDLLDRVEMKTELQDIFGRSVDLAEEKCLANPYRRKNILAAKEVIYAA